MKVSRLLGGLAAATVGFAVASTPAPQHRFDAREVAALVAANIEFAAPSESTLIVRQPNGNKLRAQIAIAQMGGNLEVDGYTVLKGRDGWWRYAGADGAISKAVVGRDAVAADVPKGVGRLSFKASGRKAGAREQFATQLDKAARLASKRATAAKAGVPVEFRFPVLMLATWWDSAAGQTAPQFQPGTNTSAYFAAILDGFGGNPKGSLTEFYFENSYGQFLVKVDVHGPYVSNRSREDRCYYGGIDAPPEYNDDLDPTDSVLGVGGLGVAGMVAEGVPLADPLVDFSVYDNDGDGYVDMMGVIHSGADMATTGDPCNTWSHALPISAFDGIVESVLGLPTDTMRGGLATNDGVRVDRVFTMPEFNEKGGDLYIGVAAHEMSHAIGEPDYYAVNGSSSGDGDWDVMSGGSYMGNPGGSNPTWFNPASRVFQGWVTPTIVHGDVADVRLRPRSAPVPGYTAGQPHPGLILVPNRWIKVGDTDETGYKWTTRDVYGLVLDGDRGYVIEGWYLENVSRLAGPYAPLAPEMSRSPYFDRGAHGSGLLAWHFDYWRRSNVYFGANNAQDDANRMQMDVEEFDFYDNSQEIARNLHRGESADPFRPTATGMTSGTHQIPPDAVVVAGDPQGPVALSGTTTSAQPADAPFTVDDNPANYTMRVSIIGDGPPPGDCKLQLFRREGEELQAESAVIDSGFVGDAETVTITLPTPGEWLARVSDYAACTSWTGSVTFTAPGGFNTKGSADTWSNFTKAPTGWAFTNIRGGAASGLEFGAETFGANSMVVDLLQLAGKADVSPGYAMPAKNSVGGRGTVNAGRPNAFSVPIFSNGGVAPGAVGVLVRRGRTADGPIVASGTVTLGAYEHKEFKFNFRPGAEGPYDLRVTVDPANALVEGTERNNLQIVSGWAGPAAPTVLIVDDEGYTDGERAYAGALAAIGVPYAIATEHVSAATMAQYQAVIWVGAIDRGPGQLDANDRAEVETYLGGGGRLWLASNRAAGAIQNGDGAGPWLASWFGATTLDTTTLETAYTVSGTGNILGATTFELQPYPVRPFSDLVGVAPSGVFGAAAGVLKLANAQKPGRDGQPFGTSVVGDADHGLFKTVLTPFSLSQASTPDTAIGMTRRVMQFFGVATGQYTVTRRLIYHVAARHSVSGTAIPITAIGLGGATEAIPRLFFQRHGQSVYRGQNLVPGAEPGSYAGVIAADQVVPQGLDYHLRNGVVYDPPLAAEGLLDHGIATAIPELR